MLKAVIISPQKTRRAQREERAVHRFENLPKLFLCVLRVLCG
jgi:hypothetical protein